MLKSFAKWSYRRMLKDCIADVADSRLSWSCIQRSLEVAPTCE